MSNWQPTLHVLCLRMLKHAYTCFLPPIPAHTWSNAFFFVLLDSGSQAVFDLLKMEKEAPLDLLSRFPPPA